ncbi:hypothetical protein FOZ60_003750 [Perkinsus olseni]|uniref:SWIM-type domain-containing protein n=1 Tax=Perkinsus olseni TaxID=32597 RepID=A0A7J6PHX6_PEROL|nr:hypothetical protein FOZ60_003750 [Perkinsus olseni]
MAPVNSVKYGPLWRTITFHQFGLNADDPKGLGKDNFWPSTLTADVENLVGYKLANIYTSGRGRTKQRVYRCAAHKDCKRQVKVEFRPPHFADIFISERDHSGEAITHTPTGNIKLPQDMQAKVNGLLKEKTPMQAFAKMRDIFGRSWDDVVNLYTPPKIQQYLENHRKHILRRDGQRATTFDDLLEEVRLQDFKKLTTTDLSQIAEQLRGTPVNARHSSPLLGHWYELSTERREDKPRKSSVVISSRGAIVSLFNATDPTSQFLMKGPPTNVFKPAGLTICIDGHFRSFRSGSICVIILSVMRIGNPNAKQLRNAACPLLVCLSLTENKQAVRHMIEVFRRMATTFHKSPVLAVRLISDSAPAIVRGTKMCFPNIVAQRCHFHAKQRVDRAPAPSEGNKGAYKNFVRSRLDWLLMCAGGSMYRMYAELALDGIYERYGLQPMKLWQLSWLQGVEDFGLIHSCQCPVEVLCLLTTPSTSSSTSNLAESVFSRLRTFLDFARCKSITGDRGYVHKLRSFLSTYVDTGSHARVDGAARACLDHLLPIQEAKARDRLHSARSRGVTICHPFLVSFPGVTKPLKVYVVSSSKRAAGDRAEARRRLDVAINPTAISGLYKDFQAFEREIILNFLVVDTTDNPSSCSMWLCSCPSYASFTLCSHQYIAAHGHGDLQGSTSASIPLVTVNWPGRPSKSQGPLRRHDTDIRCQRQTTSQGTPAASNPVSFPHSVVANVHQASRGSTPAASNPVSFPHSVVANVHQASRGSTPAASNPVVANVHQASRGSTPAASNPVSFPHSVVANVHQASRGSTPAASSPSQLMPEKPKRAKKTTLDRKIVDSATHGSVATPSTTSSSEVEKPAKEGASDVVLGKREIRTPSWWDAKTVGIKIRRK